MYIAIAMKFSIDTALEVLERSPVVLDALLSNLSDEWIYSNEGDNTWSPFDVIGHLIHGEKADWVERLNIIYRDGKNKTFEPFDRFAQFEDCKGKSMSQLLNEFKTLRQQNITYLKTLNLTDKDFNLKAAHPSLGEVSLMQLLATWVTHDLGHIAQISRVMAKQYKDEVGPWREYISVLNR